MAKYGFVEFDNKAMRERCLCKEEARLEKMLKKKTKKEKLKAETERKQ